MQTKQGRDLPILEITKENYLVEDKEAGVYHVKIEQTSFDRKTGKRISKPRIQKFGIKEWATVNSSLKRQDYTATILHDPLEFKAENDAKVKKALETKKQKDSEAKQKQAEEERAALKAELLAELKAEMQASGGTTGTGKQPTAGKQV